MFRALQGFDAQTGRLSSTRLWMTSGTGEVIAQDLDYVWDHYGNLTSRYDIDHAGSTTAARAETFTYDKLDRLTGATLNGTTVAVA